MKLLCECLYCGHKWEKLLAIKDYKHYFCPICNDTNIKTKDLAAEKIDYYKGCPPFPEESIEPKGEWHNSPLIDLEEYESYI